MNDRRPTRRRGVALVVAVLGGLGGLGGAPAGAGAPEADFAARTAHPDVVYYEGFDSAPAVTGKVLPDARARYATFSSAQKASGAGSLQFEIPSLSPANSSGNWRSNFSADNSVKFGANTSFYVQWRQRFSASMLNTLYTVTDGGGGGWKQVIIGEGDYAGSGETVWSCTRLEVVVNNNQQRHFPQLYHSCGDYWPYQEPYGGNYYKLQSAVDAGASVTPIQNRFPLYPFEPTKVTQLRAGSPAFPYYPDEWMTFQIHLAPGPLGCAVDPLIGANRCGFINSTVEMWVAREGRPSVLTHRFTGVVLQRDAGATATAEKYGKIWLTPYHTNKDAAQAHAVGYTWYDELIVSRSRIADPGVSSAPKVTPANSGEGRDIRSTR